MTRTLVATLALAVVPAAPAAAQAAQLPSGDALVQAIRAADSTLFRLFFEGCDPERLRTMVSDDLEFYHDKSGVVAGGGPGFVADYTKNCEARKAPDAWRSRRALVAETLVVDPVPGFGAIEAGEHLFYERKGDGPERLAGRAAFTMVWRYQAGTWRLARVLSFRHRGL